MGRKRRLLEEIDEMGDDELLAYVEDQSRELEIEFHSDLLNGTGRQALLDFIADNIHPELQGELHSECQLSPGCSMFPNAETDEELNEELEHL